MDCQILLPAVYTRPILPVRNAVNRWSTHHVFASRPTLVRSMPHLCLSNTRSPPDTQDICIPGSPPMPSSMHAGHSLSMCMLHLTRTIQHALTHSHCPQHALAHPASTADMKKCHWPTHGSQSCSRRCLARAAHAGQLWCAPFSSWPCRRAVGAQIPHGEHALAGMLEPGGCAVKRCTWRRKDE